MLERVVNPKKFGAVGDGAANDTTAVQAAINAAGTRPLYFPAGTYAVKGVHLKSGLVCVLAKGAKIIAHASATFGGSTLDANGESDISIEGGTIDGNLGVVPGHPASGNAMLQMIGSTNVVVRGTRFQNNAYLAVVASQSRNIRVLDCDFYNTDCAILTAQDCHDIWAVGNNIDGGTSDGIAIWSTSSSAQSTGIHLVSNRIRNKTGGYGIILRRAKAFEVAGNTIADCAMGIGISPVESSVLTERGVISGNTISGVTSSYGIGGFLARYVTIANNVVSDCRECGIWGNGWTDCVVASNIVVNVNGKVPDTDAAGIRVSGQSKRVSISGNTVIDDRETPVHYAGIQVGSGVDRTRVAGNIVPHGTYPVLVEQGATNTTSVA